jgi:serine/threonine-protein kinase
MLGEKIGHYRITRLIGKGGMGLVYEGLHEEIERRAAIKVLLPQFTNDPEAASRFLNEARAVNIVSHPSLVSIFEFGRLPDGDRSAYIVMEYLEGETLRARMDAIKGPMGSEALRIARQIASALAAAHAKHIIHRDLKPANVMLVPDQDAVGGERVKVLDFGIAKLTDHARPAQAETRVGSILGSPWYMSPEQCRNIMKVDDRSDVYSLGVILYEMLTGRVPFDAESDAEVMGMQMYIPPPSLRELVPTIAADVEKLVLNMLDKAPASRPSMRDVLNTINGIGGFGATESRPAIRPLLLPPAAPPSATLSSATGEGLSRNDRQRRVRFGLLAGGALLGFLFLLLGVGLVRRLGQPHPVVSPVTVPASGGGLATSTVHLSLTSEPPGAEVWNAAGDQLLGQTPYSIDVPRATGAEQLLLRLPGYAEMAVTLDRDVSAERSVALVRKPGAGERPNSKAGKGGAVGKSDADRRSGKQKSLMKRNAGIKIIN